MRVGKLRSISLEPRRARFTKPKVSVLECEESWCGRPSEGFMEGKRVRLRAYERGDIEQAVKWTNDEEVTQFLGPHLIYPTSSIQFEKWLETSGNAPETTKTFVIEKLNGDFLGSIGLTEINWVDRSAEVHIIIGYKTQWGQGLGTDAMRVILRLAFEKMNLHRLWLRVYSNNERAIASYEKCGFKREGVLRDTRWINGRYHDTVVMGILADEYGRAG